MTLEQAAGYIRTFDSFILASHDGPDADGLGAAYSLTIMLESLGKKARLVFFEAPASKLAFIDRRGWFGRIQDTPELPFPAEETCAIVVDTHDFAFLGSRMESLVRQAKGLLVIDHHEPKGRIDEGFVIDSAASSTCEMVWRLGGILGVELPPDAAEAIFAGIVYDTGSFAYPKTGADTFACALDLVRRGVKPYAIYGRVYESGSVAALLLERVVLGSLDLQLDNRLAFQVLRLTDLESTGALYEDAEEFVNTPLKSGEVEVSVLLKENQKGRWRCSLRSKGLVNVAHVAHGFGGGGHWTAAGFSSPLPLEELKSAVLQTIEAAFVTPRAQEQSRKTATR
ncbi:MAG TPA: bifunctional oligoribonuclease/PAP phosphatase NrnA [Rectinemataceae bacterium]|nr:bifunctional oligoribonuclease/PAP phosphatase NrnA [Rectinemataceae bacterium]